MRERWEAMRAHGRRLGAWWVAAGLAVVLVAMIADQQLGVLVYKVAQVLVAMVLIYIADRTLFRMAPFGITPDMPQTNFGAARLLARALVALAIIIGVTVGI